MPSKIFGSFFLPSENSKWKNAPRKLCVKLWRLSRLGNERRKKSANSGRKIGVEEDLT